MARFAISVLLIAVAVFLWYYQPDAQRDAIAVSLVTIVAGFWLHVLPTNGK